ncbi:MAG: DNA translocase FtsK 4TM domain-containing protein [Magnetococcales bacterium]|nr:DNA translocase FtsK 4TM domain-containing protein [Magnetococcales bacterium]
MAARSNQYRHKKNEQRLRRQTRVREGLGIFLLCLTAYLALALSSYSPEDPSFNQTGDGPLNNLGGETGAYLSDLLLQSFGYSAGWLLVFGGISGFLLFSRGKTLQFWDRLAALPMLAVVTVLLSSLLADDSVPSPLPAGPGGLVGYMGAKALIQTIGLWGSLILLVPLGVLAIMVLSRFSIIDFIEQTQARRKERKEAAEKLAASQQPETNENIEPQVEKPSAVEVIGNTARSVVDSIAIVPAVVQRFFSKLLQKSFSRQLDWLTPMEADPVVEINRVRVEPEMDFNEPLVSEPATESHLDEPVVDDALVEEEVVYTENSKIDEDDVEEEIIEEEFEEEEYIEEDDFEEEIVEEPPVRIAPVEEPFVEDSYEPEVVEEVEEQQSVIPPTPAPNLTPLKAEPAFEDEIEDEGPIAPMEIPVNMPKPMAETPASGTLESEEEAAKQDMPLPSLDMLTEPPLTRQGPSQDELSTMARLLEQKLADFKIKGQIVDVMPGPVVTTFELDPAPGLRASKVVTISDDLARSISAESVRVVGNVPGKTVIGIELPNEIRATVYLREVLQSEGFKKFNHPLAVALGSDINGVPFSANLAKMPHLLVAGTTGSGKSVAVNAMICSILFNARPHEVRFLMIDPKMLELSIYEGIPHLLAPVVTDVHKAANLLKWAVAEMEERYRLMSELGVRNLVGFNEKIDRCIESGEQPTRRVKVGFDPETGAPVEQEEPIPLEKKPLIVIVIDELADLMIQVGKEVEPAIARLAQMARAAGLHLVIATQRPSVDVITGLIKANFPTRLAFQVSSKIDSRTILDSMGAERLLGMGDGLYLPPGTSLLKRIHAPFVSDEEVNDLVKYLKTTGKPQYNEDVLVARSEDDSGPDLPASDPQSEDYDPLYDQAAAVVVKAGKVSTSMVQRHFKIGYNRAARIVERMEADGLISAANGAGKREVLAPDGGDFS